MLELQLSKNYSLEEVKSFQEQTKGKVLEMRTKYGMLLALGTSLKALTEAKHKNGNKLFYSETKKVIDYDAQYEIVVHDCIIKPYEERSFSNNKNEKLLKSLNNAENYWKKHYENFLVSKEMKKDYPDILLDKF